MVLFLMKIKIIGISLQKKARGALQKRLGRIQRRTWCNAAKGFCNLCDEDEIKNSVIYTFHLARKAQAAEQKQKGMKERHLIFKNR